MTDNTRVCLAVFDMVGTTVESGDEVPTSFRAALATVGVALTDEAVKGIRGRSKRDAIAELIATHVPAGAGDARLVETVYARFQEVLRAEYRTRARAVPGAQEVLLQLKNAGVHVVLNTGLDGETARLLVEGLAWQHLGLGLVSGDDVRRGRPAPDLIEAAMRLTGVDDAGAVVSVGDTTSDLDAAAAAQVGWSVGVLSGAHGRSQLESHPHSVLLDSVTELPRWLERVGALAGNAAEPGSMSRSVAVDIETIDPAHEHAQWCLARYFEELARRFEGGFDPAASIMVDHSDLVPPHGVFLVARVEGKPVACGAVKRTSPEVGYIKRMWVAGSVRGLGLGRRMLAALENATLELGCSVAQLETNQALTEAIRLYESAGYREVEPFNEEPYAHHWFEKRLDG